ncbi:unnamed protein product [Darwinula stevensoni]|uniref:Uncharacterized protein n=1 Tax=Darwinula stevensoni TaxID=69355 RepID=A0A7R8X4V5_9CRUS|nr:unnamed protein product [Darwinula stevensoni]CAG0886463.1 unnamed protein product [Darwinula stevensoni]
MTHEAPDSRPQEMRNIRGTRDRVADAAWALTPSWTSEAVPATRRRSPLSMGSFRAGGFSEVRLRDGAEVGNPETANGLIQYFRSNPTAQNIRIETRSSVEFPEVTVCPGIAWNFTALKVLNETWITAYKSIWSGLFQKLLNISVLEALNSFTLTDFNKIVATCTIYPHPFKSSSCSPRHGWTWIDGSRVYETDAGYWRESPIVNWHGSDSPLKFCYTLHVKSELRMPLSSISPVMELGLSFKDSVNELDNFNKFDKSGNPYYQIRIDSSQEPFTAVRNITLSGQIFFLLDGKSYMLSLSLKYYHFLPSGSKCNGDEDYDYKKCVETAITERLMKKAPCVKSSVLPMKHDQAATLRQCNTSQDERDLINYYHGVQKHFDPGCPRKCKRTTYNAIQLDDPDFPYDPHYGMIKLNTPKAEVEIVNEHELTSLEQFLSSIGGMVGLYLGVSLIGVYECLEFLAVWLKSQFLKAQIERAHL